MDDILSLDDIFRWIKGKRRPDKDAKFWEARGDWSFIGFCRAVGVDESDMNHMAAGHFKMPLRVQKRVSRFIRDWENGLLTFVREPRGNAKGAGHRKMVLRHLQVPKPRGMSMSVSWTKGPKLTIAPRPSPNPRIPQFRDLFANLQQKR